MDSDRFDLLTKRLATALTRRAALRLGASLPLLGSLSAWLDADESVAVGRRKRRKKRPQRPPGQRQDGPRARRRKDTKAQACIPTGKRCPAKKPRGKKGKKLGCRQCCQRHVETDANGKQRCACQPIGQGCRETRECCSGSCAAGTCQHPTCSPACTGTTPICQNNACVSCSATAPCPPGQLCLTDGSCQLCTVTCPGGACDDAALQAAVDAGGTVYACPGRYTSHLTFNQDATLIGAGDGANPAVDTILDAQGGGPVVDIATMGATVALHGLRIRGGNVGGIGGGGIFNEGFLSLTRCTITGNNAPDRGGGIHNRNTGRLTLTDCVVTENTAGFGGGIYQDSNQPVALHNTVVQNNHAVQPFPGVGGIGGGIQINVGSVTITDNSRITANTAATAGGGIFNNGMVTCSSGSSVGGNTVGGNPSNCIDSGGGMGCNACPV